jgi:hypothetical protein
VPPALLVIRLNPGWARRGNADRNASRNIGQRLLACYLDFVYLLYQEKPCARPLAGRVSKEPGVSFLQKVEANIENCVECHTLFKLRVVIICQPFALLLPSVLSDQT